MAEQRPNWIEDITARGVFVATEKSRTNGAAAQLVPAWMIRVGWDRLSEAGELSQQELLNDLNVKRSAAVVAMLARLPDVSVRSTRPVVLTMRSVGVRSPP